jgi:hypothetical protein
MISKRKRPILLNLSVLSSTVTSKIENRRLRRMHAHIVERVLEFVGMRGDLDLQEGVEQLMVTGPD